MPIKTGVVVTTLTVLALWAGILVGDLPVSGFWETTMKWTGIVLYNLAFIVSLVASLDDDVFL